MKKCVQVARLTNVKFEQQSRIYGIEGLSPTITTNCGGGHGVKIMDNRPIIRVAEATKKGYAEMGKSQIRKLTPRECWRLMGFDDSDFDKAQAVNSDTQLYKQAGNSIVVNVLEAILGNLLVQERSDWLDELLS